MAREQESSGALVRRHRLQRGLTQTALARQVLSCQPRISHIERGELPSPELVHSLEAVLDLGGELRDAVSAEHTRRAAVRGAGAGLPVTAGPVLVGRDREMRQLDAAVAAGHRRLALDGPAGSGKTALATAWSERHSLDETVMVAGHTLVPERRPRPLSEITADLLRQLGGRCASPDPAAHLRAVQRAARVGQLVVLDDVDGDQIAPLLPALGHCVVVLTARRRQHELAVGHHVRRLPVDGLPLSEACALLAELLDTPRAVLQAVREEIAQVCDGLPFALLAVAEALRDTGVPPLSPVTGESLLPILQATAPALLHAIRQTYEQLDAGARAVLHLAAEQELITATDAPREVLALLREQLLRADDHGQLSCPELVRAVLAQQPGGTERRLHAVTTAPASAHTG